MASAPQLVDQNILEEEFKVLQELERRRLEQDFGSYVREAWKITHPFEKLIEGWYLDVIADYLTALKKGQISRLIINQPPRTLKSTATSIFFPTWVWTQEPWWRFIFYSYSFEKLSTPHSLERRRLIESMWYRERWGNQFSLSVDENMKWLFSNNKSGRMEVVSGATGTGGKCVIIDDPHSAMQALSDAEREAGVLMVRQGLMTRLDNPETDHIIVVMQRLHEKDVTGEMLADQGNWTHLCLPAEAEADTKIFLPASNKTIIRKKGDLLDPVRLGKKVLEQKKKDLGSRGYAGQYLQRPAPAGGTIFESKWWGWWDPVKVDWKSLVDEVVVSVDTAVKDIDEGSDVAIQAWGISGIRSYLLKRDTEKRNFAATKAAIRSMMIEFGADLLIVEDKSNGPAIISELKTEFHIAAYNPNWGDKTARAQACSPMVEAGNVFLPQNGDGVLIQSRATLFPNVEMKDDIDAMTQFLNWRRNRGSSLEWMKAMAERAEKGETVIVEEPTLPSVAELQQAASEEVGITGADKIKERQAKAKAQALIEQVQKEEAKTDEPEKKTFDDFISESVSGKKEEKTGTPPTVCKFCGSTTISVSSQGVWCYAGCGKRYPWK